MKLLVVLDLDATCTEISWRIFLGGKEPSKSNPKLYSKWLKKVQSEKYILQDPAVPGMRELAHLLKKHAVYVTSRQEKFRKATLKWLKKNKFPKLDLYMRKDDNYSDCGTYKAGIVLDLLKKKKYSGNSVIVIDDDIKGEIESVSKLNKWTFLKAKSGR